MQTFQRTIKEEMQTMRRDFQEELKMIKRDMVEMEQRLKIFLGTLIIGMGGSIMAIKFFN